MHSDTLSSSFLLTPITITTCVPVAVLGHRVGGGLQIQDQGPGRIKERQGCVLGAHYSQVDKVQPQLHPPGSQFNWMFYNKAAQWAGHAPERWGELQKPTLPSAQPVSSGGIVFPKLRSQKYENFCHQYLIILFCPAFSVLELKTFMSSIFEVGHIFAILSIPSQWKLEAIAVIFPGSLTHNHTLS